MVKANGMSPSPFWQPSTPGERLLALCYKSAFLALLLWGYLNCTSSLDRAGSVGVAVVFIVIELTWTTIAHEDPKTGSVSVKGWQGKFGHSSFAQFWSNVVWGSMLLFRYREVIGLFGLEEGWARSALFVFMFPFSVWWLEIVEGYILIFLFGKNVAWEYKGKAAYFHGTITIEYFVPWLGLGAAIELLWDSLILDLIKEGRCSGQS
ncbi:hypothetical protein TrRE_jg11155 [Triparma retinervis]|uniref:Uncharacterized protein n=1 Tax=Triparma retinervis TaxID=2557542 RepID=A0A9W7A6K5_9STRA|nr:hypothetical protein TrRE_jg11155 [Triparma retinervis]